MASPTPANYREENERLKEINADLLEALRFALPFLPLPREDGLTVYSKAYEQAHAAIAKATGS